MEDQQNEANIPQDLSEPLHRRGLNLKKDTANVIMGRFLPDVGECQRLTEISTGFNNKSYIVTPSSGNKDYVLRITKNSWAREKVQCEMVALKFVSDNTSIPVPTVVACDSSGDEFGFMWILMDKMPGENLHDTWSNFTESEQKELIKQAVNFLGQLQRIKWDTIGGFYTRQDLKSDKLLQEHITVDKYFEQMEGPFSKSSEWALWQLENSIKKLETNKAMRPLKEFLPRANRLASLLSNDPGKIGLQEVPIVTFHGDLAFRNMLVQKSEGGPKITALLDWEWAGAMPAHFEWDHSSFQGNDLPHHKWFQEEASRQGLHCPATIQGYENHMALIQIWTNLSPWQIGCFDERNDEKVLAEAKRELLDLFQTFNL